MARPRTAKAKARNNEAHKAVKVLSGEIAAKRKTLQSQRRAAPLRLRRAIDLEIRLLDDIESELLLLGYPRTSKCILA